MYQREAMWLQFGVANSEYPKAVKVLLGKVNAIDGVQETGACTELRANPQNYVVIPSQPWLDGINAGNGYIKQFVAMPMGQGYNVEHQVTGEETAGGIQLIVTDSKDRDKVVPVSTRGRRGYRGGRGDGRGGGRGGFGGATESKKKRKRVAESIESEVQEMGVSAGGRMKQDIVKDPHGVDHWDQTIFARVFVHIVNSESYHKITGKNPPNTPITAKSYTENNLPWFDYYDEVETVEKSDVLANVKSVKQVDQDKRNWPLDQDETVPIQAQQVKKLKK